MNEERHRQLMNMSSAERVKEMMFLKMARSELIREFSRSEPVREIDREIEFLHTLFGFFGMKRLDGAGKSPHDPSQPE